jgi:hypothetical protein
MSDREIAREANVNHHLVGKLRKTSIQLGAAPSSNVGRIGKDGKRYNATRSGRATARRSLQYCRTLPACQFAGLRSMAALAAMDVGGSCPCLVEDRRVVRGQEGCRHQGCGPVA